MSDDPRLTSPGVRFPPPALFAAGFLIGWLLETRAVRVRLAGGSADPQALRVVGALLLAAGMVLGLWGVLTFRRARTAIVPFRAASRLVEEGPYRFTRNPMYAGLTAVYLGLTIAANMAWPIVLLPLVLVALHVLVIRREEEYLAQAFGEAYAEYRGRVRRWM